MPSPGELMQIRAAVAGHDLSIPRREAMERLLLADIPDKHRDLETVLRNEDEDRRFRALAAVNLGRLGGEQAAQALLAGSQTSEPTVLILIMRALGRIGGPAALPTIDLVVNRTTGAAQRQARFAATLIAHRFDLEGYRVRLPPESGYLPLPPVAKAQPRAISVQAAGVMELEAAVASLNRQLGGIALSTRRGWMLACGDFEWLLVWQQAFDTPGSLTQLLHGKAVPALVALKAQEDDAYRPALTVLTAPGSAQGVVEFLVHTQAGRLAYAGSGTLEHDWLRFTIRSVVGGISLPVLVAGEYDGQNLKIETASSIASAADHGRSPQPLQAVH